MSAAVLNLDLIGLRVPSLVGARRMRESQALRTHYG